MSPRCLSTLCTALLLASTLAAADAPASRWDEALRRFDQEREQHPEQVGGVVFYGSSTFTRWLSLAQDLPGVAVVNRGFGGSGTADAVQQAERVVAPLRPATVVLYTGGNDIGKRTPTEISDSVKQLVETLHRVAPQAGIILLSLKPTLKRLDQVAATTEVNRLYAQLAASDPTVTFVDLWTPFLDESGQPDRRWLGEDGHHPSAEGYRRIAGLLAPLLPAVRKDAAGK